MTCKKELLLLLKELILKIKSTGSLGKTLLAVIEKSYNNTYKVFCKKKFHKKASLVASYLLAYF